MSNVCDSYLEGGQCEAIDDWCVHAGALIVVHGEVCQAAREILDDTR